MSEDPRKLLERAIEIRKAQESTFKRVPKDKLRESIKLIQKNHAGTLKQLENR
ncbi:hypothetical protein [Celerinatantimonas sp. MCCC 1A17872]|uniref:hypothetical protein n=1 Tax=Celerinatantimonas sp. MCCC 1A17872 TaxID=3177514 RepID=UPI0038C58F73